MNKSRLGGRKIFVAGLQGSGKTQAAKWLTRKCFKRAIMVRFTPDFDDVRNLDYVRAQSSDGLPEMRQVAKFLTREGEAFMEDKTKTPTYDAWIIDEADLLFQSGQLRVEEMQKIVAMHRHYGLAVVFITRRPQDIPAKIVESCQFQLYFPVEGKNVNSHIASVDPRILEQLSKIRYQDYRFVLKEIGQEPKIHKKLDV